MMRVDRLACNRRVQSFAHSVKPGSMSAIGGKRT
jgi:hypothetical protein